MRADIDDTVTDGRCRVSVILHVIGRQQLAAGTKFDDGNLSISSRGVQFAIGDYRGCIMSARTTGSHAVNAFPLTYINTGEEPAILNHINQTIGIDRRWYFGDTLAFKSANILFLEQTFAVQSNGDQPMLDKASPPFFFTV